MRVRKDIHNAAANDLPRLFGRLQVGVAHRRDGEVGIIRQHDQETSREGIEERAEVQQFSLGYRTQAYNKACRSFQAA